MKKNRLNWLYLITVAAYALMLIWLFMFPGTKGLIIWDPGYGIYFYVLIFVGIIPIILWLLDRFIFKKRIVSAILKSISFILLLVPIAAVIVLLMMSSFHPTDLEPLLMINDSTSADRYTLAYWTKEKRSDTLELRVENADGIQTISLEDEKPTNKHYFSFGDEASASYEILGANQPFTFETTEPSKKLKRFAITSDAHIASENSNTDNTKKMLKAIKSQPYHCLFMLGDIMEFGFSFQQWIQSWEIFASEGTAVPFKTLVGNHDVLFGGNKLFHQFFGKDYFRVDFDDVHFIGMNLPWGVEELSKKQTDWLEQQLNSIPKQDWTIVLTHAFLYASGFNYNGVMWADNKMAIEKLTPLFEKTGVDMVFSGHNHQMEHLSVNGIDYFITGTFGSLLDPQRELISTGSQWYNNKNHGYVDLSVGLTSATVTFLNVDSQELYSFAVKR